MKPLEDYISSARAWRKLIIWLKRKKLKSYHVSLYRLLEIFLHKIKKDDIEQRSHGVAFNFTLSIFPAILFLFSIIPFIPVADLDSRIVQFLAQVLPKGIWEEAAPTISDIVSRPRVQLLSFGFLFTAYASSNGMVVLMDAFNKCYRTKESRGLLYKRFVALVLTVLLGVVLLLAIIMLILGQYVVATLRDASIFTESSSLVIVVLLQYALVFLVFFMAVALIYYVAPSVHVRWRFISPGSVLATILCILVTRLFSVYLSSFATYNKLYGSIGTFIGLMLWFYLLALILLFGFEINATLDEARAGLSAKVSPPHTLKDKLR